MTLRHALSLSRHTLPAFMAVGVFWGAFAAFVPVLKANIGATDGAFGLVLLSAALGAVVAMGLAPIFSARTGRYAMLIVAAAMAVAFQGPVWASTIWTFAGAMVFAGASAGLLDVVMNARLSMVESRHKASLMNLNHAAFSFAYAGSAIVAGLAREASVDPKLVFFALFLVVILLATGMVETTFEQPVENDPKTQQRLPLSVFWGGLIILAAFMTEQAVESWSALHIERSLHGGAAEGALGPALLGLTMGFGRLAGQFIASRFAAARVIAIGAVVSALGALIAAMAPSPLVAYVGFGALGIGVSVMAPMAFALVGQSVCAAQRAQAISRAAMLGYAGFFIGPPVLGFVAEATSLRISFALIALVILTAPLLTNMIRRGRDAA